MYDILTNYGTMTKEIPNEDVYFYDIHLHVLYVISSAFHLFTHLIM